MLYPSQKDSNTLIKFNRLRMVDHHAELELALLHLHARIQVIGAALDYYSYFHGCEAVLRRSPAMIVDNCCSGHTGTIFFILFPHLSAPGETMGKQYHLLDPLSTTFGFFALHAQTIYLSGFSAFIGLSGSSPR
jgi:hypothetical protein